MELRVGFELVVPLAERCRAAGGRALVVGGAVRDALLGREAPPDLDVEVHGLDPADLERLLRRLGRVNLVGHAFAVYKLQLGDRVLDVSLPRRDSRVGPGHRGVEARGDPHLGIVEAARRRDLTINAMAFDPLEGALLDPFHGQRDLGRRLLRAVDPSTFGDDPLRALRVPQFGARFRFKVHADLLYLCRAMPIDELPAERVRGEIRKLLLLAAEPSWGLDQGCRMGLWARVHPGFAGVDWHATCPAVDRAAALRAAAWPEDEERGEALLLAALLHRVAPPDLEPVLDRLAVHRQKGFPVRAAVLALINRAAVLDPAMDDRDLRHAAREAADLGGLALWLAGAEALTGAPRFSWLRTRAEALGLALQPPRRLVRGRDLRELGFPTGPLMGEVLEHTYRHQLDHGIEDAAPLLDHARQELARLQAEASEVLPDSAAPRSR